ncbi:MAG TPA: ABC transporter permease [bacterium]|nr:ABC transporter permease [bacterium]
MPLIELIQVARTYRTGSTGVQALRGISLSIEKGEFVAIMGPSGSGKSTLLHILGLLDLPDEGEFKLDGESMVGKGDDELAVTRNSRLGFVFQQFHLLPQLTALQNAELPLVYAGRSNQRGPAEKRIEQVGLARRSGHRPNQLSGGEQQRVAIARALVNDPPIILADEPTGNLDSKSEEEIISILEDLNRRGKTVIMVTHELDIGRRAQRIITMRDGRIVSDERSGGAQPPGGGGQDRGRDAPHAGRILFGDHFRQSFRAIFSHKMRSILSMMGILIGVAAVIAMLALGQGATDSIRQRLASLGSNLLSIRQASRSQGAVRLESGSVSRLTEKDAEAIAQLEKVRRVSPRVSGRAQLVYGGKNWNTSVEGQGIDYPQMRAAVPVIGRFFSEEEVRKRAKVAVIGQTVARELFGETNPVGKFLRINRIAFQVVGILPEKGGSSWRDQDDVVIIPYTTAMYRLLGKDYLNNIDAEIVSEEAMEEAEQEIDDLLRKRHRVLDETAEVFDVRNMAEIQDTIESTTRTMTMLLGSIAAISLLVGGIGIMNIMLVSVTERTREIGLRKALGARKADIMTQFLIEAVLMTVTGGVIGIFFGTGISMALAAAAEWATRVTPFSIALACGFSAAVGLVFGLWPARQASRLNPIDALRYE